MRDFKNEIIIKMAHKRKIILVTGGAGFLGSHLCDRLIEDDNYVICLDNFFTGKKENILHLLNHPNFELMKYDLINSISLEVDEIYNLACPASPIHYKKEPIKTIRTCVIGSDNMLSLAKRLQIPVLQTSTSEVYGNPLVNPQKETYWGNVNPIGSRSCYDEGKRCAEALFTSYHNESGVPIRIARISNTYGPRMAVDDGRVISNFIVAALKNEPLYIYGDGNTSRSFCFVDDLISGLIMIMNSGICDPINIGNPNENYKIKDLAKIIIDMIGSKSSIFHLEETQDDPKMRQLDISKIQKLGWSPSMSLREGLKKTIKYFKGVLEK